MNLKRWFPVALLVGSISLQAQDQVAQKYGSMITPSDLKENLSILASDAFEGRETGKRGQKIAAAFVRANFEDFGLAGPVNGAYLQPVELYTSILGDVTLKAGKNTLAHYEDFIYVGMADTGGEITVPVVFAGKGRKEDFDQIQVEGKIALITIGSDENSRPIAAMARERKAKALMVLNTADAKAFKELAGQYKQYTSGGRLSLTRPDGQSQNGGTFLVAPATVEKIFATTLDKLTKVANEDPAKGALKKFKPASLQYKITTEVKSLKSENVLGYLEGTDKKDEVVIITSHYDHIGKLSSGEGDRINNGADDDGSGTVSVIQLAKVFAQAKKDGKGPRRSILFMTVTGEEKGLLGSEYYSEHPIFPLANTVVDLNIDMVGRRDPQHKDSAPYVYVIGADKLSKELNTLSETTNKIYTNLIFDYTYNDQNHPDRLYYRSDHWNFAKKNIPIIFYFDGIHEDYHKPSDEVDKIEFDLMAKRAQCVFYTAWEIANREQRIVPDAK